MTVASGGKEGMTGGVQPKEKRAVLGSQALHVSFSKLLDEM
jgi:hypothetical protein